MEALEKRVEKLENRQNELEHIVNDNFKEISNGIIEIKTILEQREKQEEYKEGLTKEDIKNLKSQLEKNSTEIPKIREHEKRLSKMEDNQQWLWRTIIGTVITTVIGVIIAAIKFF